MFSILTNGMTMGPQGPVFPIIETIAKEGKNVKLGELLVRIISKSGIQDYNKIVVDANQVEGDNQITPEEEQAMLDDQNQFINMIAQMQGGAAGGINSIPPQGGMLPPEAPPQTPQIGAEPPLPVNPMTNGQPIGPQA
jgi:hypothetical protein